MLKPLQRLTRPSQPKRKLILAGCSLVSLGVCLQAGAQTVMPGAEAQPRVSVQQDAAAPVAVARLEPVRSALPDAPGFATSQDDESSSSVEPAPLFAAAGLGGGQVTPNANGRYDKTVLPGHPAARLTVHDKVILGIKENISPISAAGWVISAGYEQATNGSPNYGQTGKGFAQRLGAAAARSSSENIFQDSVLASVLHEDPRYYKLGSGHNFFTRLVYAGTRPIIGKTDGGHRTINFSDLGGDLAGAALTQAYYPPLNRGFDEVLKTFGGSVGGDALGFVVSEFLSDTLHGLHITHSTQ